MTFEPKNMLFQFGKHELQTWTFLGEFWISGVLVCLIRTGNECATGKELSDQCKFNCLSENPLDDLGGTI